MKKIILTTTLYQLRKFHACKDRYTHLVDKLGPKWGDQQPINLLKILEYNGTANCLWAFRAAVKHPEGDQVMRLMAADFAEAVLPIYEKEYPKDARPRKAIQAARDYANGKITAKKRAAAGVAARTTARAAEEEAVGTAAEEVAWVAVEKAVGTAAWAAARAVRAVTAAAWAVAWAAAEEAAEEAAWAAAGGAAWEAALDAAGSAALGAARDAQAKIVRKYLRA